VGAYDYVVDSCLGFTLESPYKNMPDLQFRWVVDESNSTYINELKQVMEVPIQGGDDIIVPEIDGLENAYATAHTQAISDH